MKKEKLLGYFSYLDLARVAIAEGKYEEALKYFDKAISSKDAGASVYYLKCELFFMLNRIAEAVDLMTRHGQENKNIIFTYFLTSKHFQHRGKMDEATFWWKKYQDLVYGRDKSPFNNTHKHLSLISGGIE